MAEAVLGGRIGPETDGVRVILPTVPRPFDRTRQLVRRPGILATLVGVIACVISLVGITIPSLWFDEAATVVSATRSWEALWREVHVVDAVHGFYYAIMHVWFDLVGYTPFTLRLPSAIMVGIAAALVVILGTLLLDVRFGVVAGLIFAVIPRTTQMGGEGRSYAWGAALAVGAAILFLVAVRRDTDRRRSWPWWAGYAAVSLVGGGLFLYLVLGTVAHGVTLLGMRWADRRRGNRLGRAWWNWMIAAAVGTVPLLPLAATSAAQGKQISWIPEIGIGTAPGVLVTQWFIDAVPFAVVAWVLIVMGVLIAVRPGAQRQRARRVLTFVLPIMIVPSAALIGVSLVLHPIFSPRYVSFVTPFVALAMALPVVLLPRLVHGSKLLPRALAVALVVALAGLSAPTWVAQRTVEAKDVSSWNSVAALVESQRQAEPAGTQEAIVYGPVQRHPATTSRVIAETYPAAFAGVADPLLLVPASQSQALWSTQLPYSDLSSRLGNPDVVWFVTAPRPSVEQEVIATLEAAGYHATKTWSYERTVVFRFER